MTSRASSDSCDPAQTAAVSRENNLLCYGWTVPDCSRLLAHIASGAPSGQPASHRSSNLVTQAGRIRTSMRREQIQQLQAAPRCNGGFDPGMISRRSNQPEDCSFSARLRVQTERQWWVTEPSCRGRSGCSPLPRQRRCASAGLRWWRRDGAPCPREEPRHGQA